MRATTLGSGKCAARHCESDSDQSDSGDAQCIRGPAAEHPRDFSSLLDVLAATFYRCDVLPPWRMTFVSQDAERLTGYSNHEFENLGWEKLVHPADLPYVQRQVAKAVESKLPFCITYRIFHKSGAIRHVREQGLAVHGSEGKALFLEGLIIDVTVEQELRDTNDVALRFAHSTTLRLGQVLESTSDCVFSVDREWRFTYLNKRAEVEISTGKVLCGRHILEAFPQLDETPFWPAYQEVMLSRKARVLEAFMPGLDHWYEVRVAPIDDGITVFFRNIDGRKGAEKAAREREEKLSRTLAHIPQMIWCTRPDGYHDYYSPHWYDFTGVPKGSTDGEGWNNMFHPDDQQRARSAWQQSLQTGEPYEIEYRLLHHTGEYRWVLGRAYPERDEFGDIVRWYGTCTDIHERVNAQEAWNENRALKESILESSADCIKIISPDGTLQFMNEPGLRSMELGSVEEVKGNSWSSLWPKESRDTVEKALQAALAGEPARFSGFCPTASGKPKWWDVVVSPVRDKWGAITSLLTISRDISQQREAAKDLKRASEHDPLTDLPNRRAFSSHLQAATLRAMHSGGDVALLLLDLDHFKHVNDTLGHPAGDHLLTVFAERLKASIRATDFVARLGGDEFAIILEAPNGKIDPVEMGNEVVERLRQPVQYNGRHISAGASIGGAVFPAHAKNAHELLKNADIALYALKEGGRGGTQMFQCEMREQAQVVASQLSMARGALTEKSVEPHYQVKVDMTSGRIAGLEALLRWRHGTRGLQLPDTVSEAFKDYELAAKIGALMQRKVFQDVRRWLDLGLSVGSVAINAAPAEFLRDDFAEKFIERMKRSSVPAPLIEIEVTEHAFLHRGSEYVSRALNLLNQAGVKIALDDFGTGHSSLSHLRDYPVDVVKIDRSFVDKIDTDSEVRAIVSAVIVLAKSLKIDVVAEGIEKEAQKHLLLQDGCRLGQGFHFGKAVHADEVPHLFQLASKALVA